MNDNPYEWRDKGDALWPENKSFSRENLLKIKQASLRDWEALYQGNPQVSGGNLFKRWQFSYWYPYKARAIPVPVRTPNEEGELVALPLYELPHKSERGPPVISCDLTFKNMGDSDFVAIGVWCGRGSKDYLIDQVVARMSFTQTLAILEQLMNKYPNYSAVLVEDAANGPAIIDLLKRHVRGLIPVSAQGGKIARANVVSPRFQAGDVIIPHPTVAPWVTGFVNQMVAFPTGKNDDQVDQATHYLSWSGSTIRRGLGMLLDMIRM